MKACKALFVCDKAQLYTSCPRLVTFPCSGTTGSGQRGGLSTFYQQQRLPGLQEAPKILFHGMGKALSHKLLGFEKPHHTQSGDWGRGGSEGRTWHPKSAVLKGGVAPQKKNLWGLWDKMGSPSVDILSIRKEWIK